MRLQIKTRGTLLPIPSFRTVCWSGWYSSSRLSAKTLKRRTYEHVSSSQSTKLDWFLEALQTDVKSVGAAAFTFGYRWRNDGLEVGSFSSHGLLVIWLGISPSSGDSSNAYLFISKVVHHLRSHPNLLFRFNDFIYPQFRLEYPTSSQEIRHFVIVNEETGHARIFSTTPTPPRYPSSQKEVYEHIHSKAWWSELLCSQPDTDWLECVAQIVEEVSYFVAAVNYLLTWLPS